MRDIKKELSELCFSSTSLSTSEKGHLMDWLECKPLQHTRLQAGKSKPTHDSSKFGKFKVISKSFLLLNKSQLGKYSGKMVL